jgi:hypothetical protein
VKVWWKRLGWLALAFTVLAVAMLIVLRHPAPLFRYSVREQGLTLRSDQPFDPDAARQILSRVRKRLDAFGPRFDAEVCLTHTRWRWRLFFFPAPRAAGLSYPVTPNVFIREASVERNRLLSVRRHFTLESAIEHELAHRVTYRSIGPYRTLLLPEWIREGVAEYMAGVEGFDFEKDRQAFLKNDAIMNPPLPGFPAYRRFHLLVTFLLEKQGWSMERLLREAPTQNDVERALRRI